MSILLPPTSANYTVRVDFPTYPEFDQRLGRSLEHLQVSRVSAINYQCTARWSIAPRRITDDMFFFILSGHGEMMVGGRKLSMEPGDWLHWRRGERHSANTDPDHPITVIALHYTATVAASCTLAEFLGFPSRFRLGLGHPCETLLHEACREYALRPPGHERGLEALALRLLLLLVRECQSELSLPKGIPDLVPVRRVLPALEAMADSLAEPLPMQDLAALCDLSVAQFRRVFARAVRRSPIEHLRRLRLEEACRLLRQGDQTVEQVARRVGYGEPAYFATTFKKLMGITPGRYRTQAHV